MRPTAGSSVRRGVAPRALALVLVLGLALGACAAPVTGKYGISDQAPTGGALLRLQEESAPYRKRGSGVVRGRVSVRTAAGVVDAGAGSRVLLAPATEYATARFDLFVVADGVLPPAMRAAAIRHVATDASGGFAITDLPPGSFLIASEMFWTSRDGVARSAVPYARLTLDVGATAEVVVTRTVE